MRILIFLLLAIPTHLIAQDHIAMHEATIKVDGQLNEVIWEELSQVTGFHNFMPTDEGLADHQTIVRMFHDGEFLYVGAIYEDDDPGIQTNSMKRDVSIGLSDAFVLVLDTRNQQQNAYYFSLNAYGAQADGLVERKNDGFDFSLSWNAVWKAATAVKGTHKVFEMAIPLKALSYDAGNTTFGVQMYVRDIKKNAWTILTDVPRNYRQFDLRFTKPFSVAALPSKATSRFAVTPSLTTSYLNNVADSETTTTLKPSLDIQYNLTSSLKLDATINPDFSQVDVDQQVTNLSRFAVFFPEQRNFFLENGDLFANLGVDDVNPFYSRKIGGSANIQYGLRLSGNVTPSTRLGVLNVQTEDEGENQNFSALVTEQQLSDNFTATGFLINRQETENFEFQRDFNRVGGININYKSDNKKWIGLTNYAQSFNPDLKGDNNFMNVGVWYNDQALRWNASVRKVSENYLTDVGFTPRLYHYDPAADQLIREGYWQTSAGLRYTKFMKPGKRINNIRLINYRFNDYLDPEGNPMQRSHFFNSAIFFKNLSAIFFVYTWDQVQLQYEFDPLGNGNSLSADSYQYGLMRVGYNSANNQKLRYRVNYRTGRFYSGEQDTWRGYLNYQLLPFANLEVMYDRTNINLNELGSETFNLVRFTGEVFFNTRFNWTTYIQYNTQADNFNINSRLQWEYRPLSYMYLVITDNFNQQLDRSDWGVAFKVNYRLDF